MDQTNLAISQLISNIWNICSQNGVWWLNTATTNANLKMLSWLDSPLFQVADEVVHGDLWHEDEVAQPHRGVERHDDGLNALTGLSLNNPPNCHHGSSLCKGARADRPSCGPTCSEEIEGGGSFLGTSPAGRAVPYHTAAS